MSAMGQKQTFAAADAMSAKCQKRTSSPLKRRRGNSCLKRRQSPSWPSNEQLSDNDSSLNRAPTQAVDDAAGTMLMIYEPTREDGES